MSGSIGDVISFFGTRGMEAFMVLLAVLAVAQVAAAVLAGRGVAP